MNANGISTLGVSAVLTYATRLLSSGWGLLVPLAILPLITYIPFSINQLRMMVMLSLLTTLLMLLSTKLRDYILLPAGLALTGAYLVINLSFSLG